MWCAGQASGGEEGSLSFDQSVALDSASENPFGRRVCREKWLRSAANSSPIENSSRKIGSNRPEFHDREVLWTAARQTLRATPGGHDPGRARPRAGTTPGGHDPGRARPPGGHDPRARTTPGNYGPGTDGTVGWPVPPCSDNQEHLVAV
jgi:hypothetical protein